MIVKILRPYLFLCFLLCWLSGKAAVISSSSAGGNWNAAGTWTGGVVPTAADTVIIQRGAVIQITENASIARLIFANDTASNSLTIADGVIFNITGTLRFETPTRDNRNFVFQIGNGSVIANQIEYLNSGGDSRRAIIRVADGRLEVNGNFDMNAAGFGFVRRRLEITGSGTVVFRGSVINLATLTTNAGSHVAYLGNGNYPIFTTTYHKLTLGGSGTRTVGSCDINGPLVLNGGVELALNGNVTLRDSLKFQNGTIRQNNANLILSGNFSLDGAFGATNHINQNGNGLLQVIGDSAARFIRTFPVGSNGSYTPVTITSLAANFPGTAGSRNLEIKTYGSVHPLVTGENNAARRYWRLRSTNITVVTSFGVDFGYGDGDVSAPILESSLTTPARFRNGTWQTNFGGSSLDFAGNELKVNNINTAIDGDYTFGQGSAFPATFPFAVTVRNGNWGTTSVWANNTVPTANTNVVVLHTVTDFNGSCNNVVVEAPGSLSASSGSCTINGTLLVKGVFNDSHSGGTNSIFGKVTIEPGGSFGGSGSGSGTSFTFAEDIENHGSFNVNTNTVRFIRQVKNTIRLQGTQPINFVRTDGNLRTLVDTLILEFAANEANPARFEPTVTLGDSNYNFNCTLLNKSAILVNILASRPATGFDRKFIQGSGSYLGILSGMPFQGDAGELVATASENIVDYRQPASQNIRNVDYFHLHINGDRQDRFKTLQSGRNVTIFGNLRVNNNGNVFQFGNNSQNQLLTVKGNIILNGAAYIRTSAINNVRNQLVLEGRFINNSTNTNGVQFNLNDTTFTSVRIAGSGIIAEGSGNYRFRNLSLSGADTLLWTGGGRLEIEDSLSNQASGFHMTSGLLFIPNDARFAFQGTSNYTRFSNIICTDRADRRAQIRQRIDVEVDSLFNMQADGRASLGAFYDFSGKKLHIRGRYLTSTSGGASAMRSDSLSVFILEGTAPASGIAFANGFRRLGSFVHNKTQNPAVFGQPMNIHNNLDLVDGVLTGTTNVRMLPGSTIRRWNGALGAGLAPTSGKYNVEYWRRASTGPEALPAVSLGRFTLRLPEGDTLSLNHSPIVDDNVVYVSGKFRSLSNNYLRLSANSFVELTAAAPLTLFPVGTPTIISPVVADVSTLSSGVMRFKPYRALAPNIPLEANVKLNRYVEISGNAAVSSYAMGISYADNDLAGPSEEFLVPQFWNGSAWNTSNNSAINTTLNFISMGELSGNGILTAFGETVSTKKKIGSPYRLFPNPTRGKVMIQGFEPDDVHVMDVLGKRVAAPAFRLNQTTTIDLSEQPNGIYFISISKGGATEIIRVVKQ